MSWKDCNGLNRRRMLEVARLNEGDEFFSYFPQWKHLYESVKASYDKLVSSIERKWEEYQNLQLQNPSNNEVLVSFVRNQEQLISKVLWQLIKGTSKTVKSALLSIDIRLLEKLLPMDPSVSTLPKKN